MMRSGPASAIAVVAIALGSLLVGCSTGADDADEVGGTTGELGETGGTPSDDSDLAIGGDTGCISGKVWNLDIPDLADQIAIELATTGFSVIEQAGVGTYTLEFDESGTVVSAVDMLVSITVVTDAPAQITVVQVHEGNPSGEWGWDGNTNSMEFANWDKGGYTVENYMTVNGINLESTIPIPTDEFGSADLVVECSGSRMTTTSAGSPYVQRWSTDG